jgi:repressor LexA
MIVTRKQQQVLDAIRQRTARRGHPPSIREICRDLGLASPGSLTKHLIALEEAGFLVRTPGKQRTWRLADSAAGPTIPVLGRIAAGAPLLAQEHFEWELPVDPALFGGGETFALQVRGDSMIEAQIREGDMAIIRPQPDIEDGRIAAVLVESVEPEATLKIVRRKNGRLELHPANPAYAPLIFEGPDLARVRILGRMVGLIRVRADTGKLFPCVGKAYFAGSGPRKG